MNEVNPINETQVAEKKTFFLRQISALKDDIGGIRLNILKARNRAVAARKKIEQFEGKNGWYRFWHQGEKRRLEKEKTKAFEDLQLSYADTFMGILRIMRDVIGIVALSCFLPLDLLQGLGRFIVKGFQKRDKAIVELSNDVTNLYAAQLQNQNLLTCPDCGHVVSKNAETCPNCGCPVSKMGKVSGDDVD
ncbi:MAG: zinc ribbon domain-containing protein [Bacteroidales bacterium]|nr:zinc ribbon domain-containing protein [Bacteroidales bacterium]